MSTEKMRIVKLEPKKRLFIVYVSRCRVIYASEIVLMISSLVPWDEASYWSPLN